MPHFKNTLFLAQSAPSDFLVSVGSDTFPLSCFQRVSRTLKDLLDKK